MVKASELIDSLRNPHELRVVADESTIEIAKLTENQYGELIEWSIDSIQLDEKGLPVSEYRYWINCWSSSWLGLGACQCCNHDPHDSYELDISNESLDYRLSLLGDFAIDIAKILNETAGLGLRIRVCGNEDWLGYYDFTHLKNVLQLLTRRAEEKLRERQRSHDEIVEENYIENQYGENVLEKRVIALADGRVKVIQLNCYSSNDLGLGTCMCQSHDPYRVYYLTGKEADLFMEELAGKIASPVKREQQRRRGLSP